VLTCLVLLLLGVAYVAARETSLFALRTVEVRGADPVTTGAVLGALARFDGESLVTLSTAEAERAAERVPTVRSVRLDRQFPNTLLVEVAQEKPVAVVRKGEEDAWLVAATGRVLGAVDRGTVEQLPRVWLPVDEDSPAVGGWLSNRQGAQAVRAIGKVPPTFPARVLTARGTTEVTLVLAGKTELRLGELRAIDQKLAAAAAVLRTLEREDADALAYLDVTLPTRPVGAPKSQLESRALGLA
jgi:cell division protein FtsQ